MTESILILFIIKLSLVSIVTPLAYPAHWSATIASNASLLQMNNSSFPNSTSAINKLDAMLFLIC